MIFTISTSGHFYSEQGAEELQRIGFTFLRDPSYFTDRPMCKSDHKPSIHVDTLDELLGLSEKWGDLIIGDGHIEIYDNYRE